MELRYAPEAVRKHWDGTHQRLIDEVDPPLANYGWRWSYSAWAAATRSASASISLLQLRALVLKLPGYVAAAEAVASLLLERPRCLVLTTQREFPLSMALVCDSFVDDAHFLWMFSGVPDSVLQGEFGREPMWPGLVGLGMLWAVTSRALANNEGREPKGLLLHAAPEGGDELLRWYMKAGMSPVEGERVSFTRANDGRYLRFSVEAAQNFVVKYQEVFR